MTSDQKPTAAPLAKAVPLERALEQNQVVEEKVEAAAEDLASANDIVKKDIAEGVTTLSAPKALANSERVESKVLECVDDLHKVNETLSQGIDDLKRIETALVQSRKALADTEVALAKAQEEEKKAQMRATHDSTTGLPTRDLFDDRLTHAISLAQRHAWTLAVMFLDLDRFKSINDTHGHAVGDGVLKEIGKRLLRRCRDEDTVCRNGGDEFLYLLINPQGKGNIEGIAGAVLNDIAQPMDIGALKIVAKASIGVAVYPDDGSTAELLIGNADTAMYRAKQRENGCVFFSTLETNRP